MLSIKSRILASACVLSLAAFAQGAQAQPMTGFSGMLDLDYANINGSKGAGDANVYGGGGSGLFSFGAINLQGDASYHDYIVGGPNVSNWNAGGEAFWRGMMGTLGATGGYDSLDHPNAHITHYGGFGEYYLNSITFAAKGGGFSGTASADGYYAGGEVLGYLAPNFALSGNVNYYHFNHTVANPNFHETDFTAEGEWLMSQRVPVSLYGGYTFSDYSGAHANTFFVGLRFYMNPASNAPLIERQREGTLDWSRAFNPTGIAF